MILFDSKEEKEIARLRKQQYAQNKVIIEQNQSIINLLKAIAIKSEVRQTLFLANQIAHNNIFKKSKH
jgi:hypothetical protein